MISYSVRNMNRKSSGNDSRNDEMSSILRERSSCFRRFFSSFDICVPRADLLMSNAKTIVFHAFLTRKIVTGT